MTEEVTVTVTVTVTQMLLKRVAQSAVESRRDNNREWGRCVVEATYLDMSLLASALEELASAKVE